MLPDPVPHPMNLLLRALGATALVLFVMISMVSAGGFIEFLAWATLGVLIFCDTFSRMAMKIIKRFRLQMLDQVQRQRVGWDEPALRSALHDDRMRALKLGHDWDVADVMAVLIKQGKPK